MITQQNLCIRPLQREDLPVLAAFQTAEVRGMYQECRIESALMLQKQLESDGICSEQFQMLMIEEDAKAVGLFYLNFIREGLVRLGFVLHPSAQGHHLASRVLLLCRDYLMENFPVVRLEADTDVDNIAAQKVLERCGFRAEGILRKYRFHHGSYHDSYLYSFIRDEWNRNQEGSAV